MIYSINNVLNFGLCLGHFTARSSVQFSRNKFISIRMILGLVNEKREHIGVDSDLEISKRKRNRNKGGFRFNFLYTANIRITY